jgi:hypothetical protein
VARVGTSAARAAFVIDCLAADASASAPVLSPELAPVTGAQAPPIGENLPPIFFLLFLLYLVQRRVLLRPRRGESLLLVQPELLAPPLSALRRCASRSLLRSTSSRSCPCAARASARARGVGGSDFASFTCTICRGRAKH